MLGESLHLCAGRLSLVVGRSRFRGEAELPSRCSKEAEVRCHDARGRGVLGLKVAWALKREPYPTGVLM